MEYRVYFLGENCRISAAPQAFEAASDDHALETCRRLFRAAVPPHHGFELWENRRHVHTENC